MSTLLPSLVSTPFDTRFAAARDRAPLVLNANALLLAGSDPASLEVVTARQVGFAVFDTEQRMYAYQGIVGDVKKLQFFRDAEKAERQAGKFDENVDPLFAHGVRTYLLSLQENIYKATRVSDEVNGVPFYGFKPDGNGYSFYPSREGLSAPGKRVCELDIADNLDGQYHNLFVHVSRSLQAGVAAPDKSRNRYEIMDVVRPALYMAEPLVKKIQDGDIYLPDEGRLQRNFRRSSDAQKAFVASAFQPQNRAVAAQI